MTARTQTGDRTALSDGGTASGGRPAMKDVSHTDSEAAASLHRLYTRGERVAVDGGRAGARERPNGEREDGNASKRDDGDASKRDDREADDEASRREEMREVDHTGSDDTDPNQVFERGGEFDEE